MVTAAVALIAGGGDGGPNDDVGGSYASVAELTAASDLIVAATVASVADGRITPTPAGSESVGTLHLDVTLRIDDVLAGTALPGDRIIVSWPAWEVGADGSRGAETLSGGQPLPEVGDRDLWFLFRFRVDVFGLTALEGRFDLKDGTITPRLAHPGGAGAEADGLSYDEMAAVVAAAL